MQHGRDVRRKFDSMVERIDEAARPEKSVTAATAETAEPGR